jgi:hypothetical protein
LYGSITLLIQRKYSGDLMARIIKQCGASLGSNGAACKRTALVNGRCKLHGGKSTGPKTAEGRARIAAAQRLRWQRVAMALAAFGSVIA